MYFFTIFDYSDKITFMKFNKIIALFLFPALLIASSSCKKDKKDKEEEETPYKTEQAYTLADVSYGNDSQQKMDIYLPANRSASTTKVFVLIHGGGWHAGDKSDFASFFNTLKVYYPNHAIININYRLASVASPGYPKQINDIQAALEHIRLPKYELSSQYFLLGASAGGHLAMLYGYAFDPNHTVKGICNTVGPTDFRDPSYTENILFQYGLTSLVGPYTYAQNPDLYAEVSPAVHVSATSPKTISFFGDSDELIPSTQLGLLHNRLDSVGVYNEATLYAGEGHGGWNQANSADYFTKLANFVNTHFGY